MSIVLQPGNHFTVVRQISNHIDTATYYVRAVIRNAYTDAIIATLDLDDKGSQRFTKNWLVPADPSGQGFYVSIVTSVYTDSGYTTKSENYGDDENTYLVQDRITVGRVGGNSGGIDAFDVRRIMKEELQSIREKMMEKEEPEEEPESEEKDESTNKLDTILTTLLDIKGELVSFKETSPDYSPIVAKIDSVGELIVTAINDKEVTEKTDIDPVLEEIRLVKEDVNSGLERVLDVTDEFTKSSPESIKKMVKDSVNESLGKAQFNLNMPFKIEANPGKEEKKEKPLRDISQIL